MTVDAQPPSWQQIVDKKVLHITDPVVQRVEGSLFQQRRPRGLLSEMTELCLNLDYYLLSSDSQKAQNKGSKAPRIHPWWDIAANFSSVWLELGEGQRNLTFQLCWTARVAFCETGHKVRSRGTPQFLRSNAFHLQTGQSSQLVLTYHSTICLMQPQVEFI